MYFRKPPPQFTENCGKKNYINKYISTLTRII
jgi:hypothetical protein